MRHCLAIALTLWAGLASADDAHHLTTYHWDNPHEDFGGLSGFDFTDNGTAFIAITDRGRMIEGRVIRDGNRITGVTSQTPVAMQVRPNQHPRDKGPDSEGIAIGQDGAVFVSFEGIHRVRERTTGQTFQDLPPHSDFGDMIHNGSFEALAIGPDGVLFTLPERSGKIIAPFPVYRFTNGSWMQFGTIERSEGFLPVGADFGPDGRFYLLERIFTGPGFRTRIRRFETGEDAFINPVTLLTTALRQHGNLEAIAIWSAPEGLRATLASDNNFLSFVPTELVEYALPD